MSLRLIIKVSNSHSLNSKAIILLQDLAVIFRTANSLYTDLQRSSYAIQSMKFSQRVSIKK